MRNGSYKRGEASFAPLPFYGNALSQRLIAGKTDLLLQLCTTIPLKYTKYSFGSRCLL